jgi:hypothetical protein
MSKAPAIERERTTAPQPATAQQESWHVIDRVVPQSNQSAGPVRFLIFCPISIFLLASLVAGKRPQWIAVADYQGMYPTIPIYWNIKSAPVSLGRSRAGPAFYVLASWGGGLQTSRNSCCWSYVIKEISGLRSGCSVNMAESNWPHWHHHNCLKFA